MSQSNIELIEAAFICITNNLSDKIKSKSQLVKALQFCGRNPKSSKIEKYWDTYKGDNGIDLDEFIKIVNKEEEINKKEIISAFKVIDKNNDGFISLQELSDMFTTKGDKMSKDEIREILDSADANKDGKLDYIEFTNLILDTVESTKYLVKKQMKQLTKKDEVDKKGKKSRENSPRSRSPSFSEHSKRAQSPALSARSSRSSKTNDSDNELIVNRPSSRNSNSSKSGLKKISIKNVDNLNTSKSKQNNKNSKNDDSEEDMIFNRPSSRNSNSSKSGLSKNLNSSRNQQNRNSESDDNGSRQRRKSQQDNLIELNLKASSLKSDEFHEPKNFKKWNKEKLGGAFFTNEKSIFSNSYILDLKTPSKVYFEVKPLLTDLHNNQNLENIDIQLIIVSENKGKVKRFSAITENKIENKWCTTCELKQGIHYIFPYTSGTFLKERKPEVQKNRTSNNILVTQNSKGKTKLSDKLIDALQTIFTIFDVDGNDRLNRKELELYTKQSEGGELDDEGWKYYKEKVNFEKNELTRDGFIEIFQLEVLDQNVDFNAVWNNLFSVGFNRNLELEYCCPYVLKVFSESSDIVMQVEDITKLSSVEQYLSEYILSKGKPINLSVKGLRDIGLFEYHNNYLVYFLIENNNKTDKKIKFNDDGCENTLFNKAINEDFNIKADKRKIAFVVQPKNQKKDWKIRLNVSD